MSVNVLSPADIDRIVAANIGPDDIPAGHTHALIADVDATGARLMFVMRRHPAAEITPGRFEWTAEAVLQHDWASGVNAVGGKLIGSW